MRKHLFFVAVLSMIVVYSGCENNFSPIGDYRKQLAVYGILSSRSDSQFVRVYTTYNFYAEPATDAGVRGARVAMTVDSTTYGFTETTIPRDDTTRYSSAIVAYVNFPERLRRGKIYSLAVNSDQGNATATVAVPGYGYVYNFTPGVFEAPRLTSDSISVEIGLSSATLGYMVRLFINFDTWDGEDTVHSVHRRLEVPFVGDSLMTRGKYAYPTLLRRLYAGFNVIFGHDAYLGVYKQQIEGLYKRHFRLTSATFILTQVESNLYNYYNVVNGFRDPYSIRMDQPDFTNIVGGVGIFGAMVEDSVVVKLQ
jgi:hypothetical protein